MNRLENLRWQLRLMCWARMALRWLRGLAGLVCVILLVLALLYAIDFGMQKVGFHPTPSQWGIMLALAASLCALGFALFIVPLFFVSENPTDLALQIDGKQKLDSDLIAALQFESPASTAWGSKQLQDAVVDYVADWGRGLKLNDGLGDGLIGQAAIAISALVLTAGLWVALAFFSPIHIFFERLGFGASHYPSETMIEQIAVNKLEFAPGQPPELRVGEGQELAFRVKASGVLPAEGMVQLSSPDGNHLTSIVLKKGEEKDGSAEYSGMLPQLRSKVAFELTLGDAWTNPTPIELVPLPIIKPYIEVIPPAYAREAAETEDPQNFQRSVLEGSTVRIMIAESSKPLQGAVVKTGNYGSLEFVGVWRGTAYYRLVKGGANEKAQIFDLAPVGTSPEKKLPHAGRWSLPFEGTPFAKVSEPVAFQLQVVDVDGFGLESPIRGSIRIKADRRPQVTAELRHRVVVPSASPVIKVRLRDDYGISKLNLVLKIVRPNKGNMEEDHVIPVPELLVAPPVEEGSKKPTGSPVPSRLPYMAKQLPMTGVLVLPLATYQLDKGDQIRLSLEATDFRGDQPGEMASSEQLVLEITDVSGVLADSAKRDEQAEKSLTDIINLQLGIGDSK